MNLQCCFWSLPFRLMLFIVAIGVTLWLDIDSQNRLNSLRMQLPKLQRQVREIQESNTKLSYEIARFENPLFLMDLVRKPEFSHMRYPIQDDVLTITLPEIKE